MKTMKTLSLIATFFIMTMTAHAQPNVKAAFNQLKESENIEKSRHSNQVKNGKIECSMEEYRFSIKKNDAHFKQLLKAFQQDANLSYSYIAHDGKKDKKEGYLIYDDKNNTTTVVGNDASLNYRLMCVMDKETSNDNYRYCYAVEWNEPTGNNIEGRLIKTYMPRPGKPTVKKSQKKKGNITIPQVHINGLEGLEGLDSLTRDKVLDALDLENSMGDIWIYTADNKEETQLTEERFLSKFNFYITRFKQQAKKVNSTLPSTYATKLLSLCKDAQKLNLSDNMHKLCIESLKELQNVTADKFAKGILEEAIIKLK